MDTTAQRGHLLMLAGTVALCPDCGEDQIMVPADELAGDGAPGELCCTSCDAAVVVLDRLAGDRQRLRRAS